MTSDPKRIAWVDYAKGIGIILVVLGHVIGSLNHGNIDSGGVFYKILFFIYSFHMPLFFFVSGFLSNNISQRRMLDVAKGMAISIAIPYFVWSSIFVLISSTFASSANHPIQLSALAGIVFPWEAVSVYWFLYDLFLAKGAYLLASQLQFNIKSNFLYYALIVFTILYIYFSISVSPGSETIYLPSTSSRLLMACTFFGIGFVLSFKPSVLTAILSKRYIIVFFITWISITFAMLRYSVFGSLDPVAALFGCFSFLSICYNIDRYDNIILRTFSASGKGGYCGFCKPRNCCRFCSHCLG